MINRAAQGLPTRGGVDSIELIDRVRPYYGMAARIRYAQIEIGGFRDVPVGPQVSHSGNVVPVVSLEQTLRVAAEELRGSFEKDLLGCWNNPAQRQPGIIDSVLAADQVPGDERPIGPRKNVIMQGVDLTESGAHFPGAQLKSSGQCGKCDVSFFQAYALFTET